ncbi:GTPase HflX [bioreactor metagenome]|uniref:GTPase HflX n=1 Tax=bioreactor metagenome TaxID=1076179 RepID=A0A645I6K2_9ZZZZ
MEAFASTLDEVRYADILLHVVDASSPELFSHIAVCNELFEKLGAGATPQIVALNKADLCVGELPYVAGGVPISALTGAGVPELMAALTKELTAGHRVMEILLPYARGDLTERLHKETTILDEEYREDGIFFRLRCDAAWHGRLSEFSL